MSNQRALRSTRRRSNSESGHPRLNSTTIDNDLVFNDTDLSTNQNNLSHQSQQIITIDMPEGYIESPMWVETGTQLQARKLPADSNQEIVIASKLENIHLKIGTLQKVIDEDPITFEGIKADHDELKGAIHVMNISL